MCCQDVLLYQNCLCETLISWEECPECPNCVTEYRECMTVGSCPDCGEKEEEDDDDNKDDEEGGN